MSALKLIMTTAGLGRFTAAQASDDIDLTIARVGLTDTVFAAAPTLTALPGEFRRLSTVSGSVEAENIVHMTVSDDEAVSYMVRGFGLFLTDNTLFAVYSQPTTIAEKSLGSMLALAIDIAFPAAGVDQITFGSTNFLNPPATTERKGVVELATLAEGTAGDTMRVTTGAVVKAMLADAMASVAQALSGIMGRTIYGSGLVTGGGDLTANRTLTVTAATAAETRAGIAANTAVTPAGLADAGAVFVVSQALQANGGYRVWSDGLKECWGSIGVAGNTTVNVAMPVEHTSFIVPSGAPGAIAQDEQSFGVSNVTAAGFALHNENPLAATFYWHTKGV